MISEMPSSLDKNIIINSLITEVRAVYEVLRRRMITESVDREERTKQHPSIGILIAEHAIQYPSLGIPIAEHTIQYEDNHVIL